MNFYPAIDLRGGSVVRLLRGDFSAETQYASDPLSVARAFRDAGSSWVHVVDLDAARTGEAINRPVIEEIVASSDAMVQCGGGVRDIRSAKALLDVGVHRVVIGTAAHEDPELVDKLCAQYPGRIAVGLDARGGVVATRGWVKGSGRSVSELVQRFEQSGVAAFIVTDIERDGTLQGPDVEGLTALVSETEVPVIASGGVGVLDDLRALTSVETQGRTLDGVIVGKALYEERFTVVEALAVLTGDLIIADVPTGPEK